MLPLLAPEAPDSGFPCYECGWHVHRCKAHGVVLALTYWWGAPPLRVLGVAQITGHTPDCNSKLPTQAVSNLRVHLVPRSTQNKRKHRRRPKKTRCANQETRLCTAQSPEALQTWRWLPFCLPQGTHFDATQGAIHRQVCHRNLGAKHSSNVLPIYFALVQWPETCRRFAISLGGLHALGGLCGQW